MHGQATALGNVGSTVSLWNSFPDFYFHSTNANKTTSYLLPLTSPQSPILGTKVTAWLTLIATIVWCTDWD